MPGGFAERSSRRCALNSATLWLVVGVLFSCVAGGPRKYELQAVVWLQTLLHLARRAPAEVVIHAFQPSEDFRRIARNFGVTVCPMERVHPRHPYSNKLIQLESPVLANASHVVLCDCDLAFCADIGASITGELIRAKVVDRANPPLEVWRWIFEAAGFRGEFRLARTTYDGAVTYANNFNGGLYILPQSAFAAIREVWPRWNEWILDRRHRLGPYTVHADQISFGLTLEELGLDVLPLPEEMNFPTHLSYAARPSADMREPLVVHYHTLDANGRVMRTGLPQIDVAIDRVNRVLGRLAAPESPSTAADVQL